MTDKTIATLTLGCKVNTYDTQAMVKLFLERGYKEVEFSKFSNIYIINTCSVTNLSDKKSRQMIRKAINTNPNACVVATGCYAQTEPNQVLQIDGIDIVIGTSDRSKIVDIVENYKKEHGKMSYVKDIMKEKIFEPLKINEIKGMTRGYLKIQEGCNQFCTYCIIPYARGPIRSREPKDVIEEVTRLCDNGIKEVVLAGIHIASYGKDIKNTSLIEMIEKVHEIDKIERIRFSSIEPNFITEENMKRLSSLTKVCDFFHLSLQSGCDKILNSMNRKYTTNEYKKAVELIRKYYPNPNISTDIIVGFPDESEENFVETCNFVKSINLSKIHVFPYSKKKGTKASKFENQVDTDTKNKRSAILRDISNVLEKKYINSCKDEELLILFENIDKNGFYYGHSTNYIKVLKKSDKNIINQIIKCKIDDIYDYNITSL